MAIIHLTEASSGAPTLSGSNGALVAVLDWAVVQNGWSIPYSSGNVRRYRPGAGNQFQIFANDDSAFSGAAQRCVIRGCESGVAGVPTDPFPRVADIADTNSNWLKSDLASGAARNYDIYVGPTFLYMFVNHTGATNIWEFHSFGDAIPTLAGDSYNTFVGIRNSATQTASVNWNYPPNIVQGSLSYFWARSYDGTVKSTRAGFTGYANVPVGAVGGFCAPQAGPSAGIDRTKMIHLCTGAQSVITSSSLSLPQRGYLPNLWAPLHNGRGSINARDTFTDTAYNPSATFRCFTSSNSANAAMIIVEETDTWSPPNG